MVLVCGWFGSRNRATPGASVVIDCGEYSCRVGSETDTPIEFPSLIGRHKQKRHYVGMGEKDCYVGKEAVDKRGILHLSRVISEGLMNRDDMYHVWHQILYNEVSCDPQEHPIVMTEPPLNPKHLREFMTETMFEDFDVPALYIASQSVCDLMSYGKTSGTVLDSGGGLTHSVSIYEGISMPHTICKLELGGNDLTNYVNEMILGLNFFNNNTLFDHTARDIKEKLCYVSLNYEQDMNEEPIEQVLYELPDGKSINIDEKNLFRITELLFEPSLLGKNSHGVHEMIFQSISKCDLDLKKEMYNNIVICGGNTMFKGFTERLNNELNQLVPSMIDVNISDVPERQHLTFKGANILASHLMSMTKYTSDQQVESYSSSWISKENYKEYGSSIVHRKCF